MLNTAEGVLTPNQNACDVVGVGLDDAIEELLPQSVGSTNNLSVMCFNIPETVVFRAPTVAIYQNNMKVIAAAMTNLKMTFEIKSLSGCLFLEIPCLWADDAWISISYQNNFLKLEIFL